ncbi:solute carrier family 13-like protein 3 [Sarcoptes scabiei]|uniref:Solute carrier family 13-like protein 3 n=1 Tax=Sarcoptes scabiei TaxID=52283 RepID=A0A132ADV0_SARSC|nr:solute carrier family 13-like protein 3 [Sarcoptes scabiei]
MVTYWFTEVIPMAITALIPVILFPLLKIVSSEEIAKSYFNGTIMVFLGSLIAACAVKKSNLHERIALKVILLTGTSPRRLFFGFMFTTAFLSMWISNLASVALMIPIVSAAFDQLTRKQSVSYGTCNNESSVYVTLDENSEKRRASVSRNRSVSFSAALKKKESKRLKKGVLIGICYASNIGGTGTLTGSSTNLVLNAFLKNDQISFSDWFLYNLPGLIILVFFLWIFLCWIFIANKKSHLDTKQNEQHVYEILRLQYQKLGPISFHEQAVLLLFGLLLMLWFFRAPDFMSGWTTIFSENNQYINDSTPTMLIVLLFFLIPAKPRNLKNSPMLLDWKTTQEKVSWSVILLLGGGFAMAKGCEKSGLSVMLGGSLKIFENFPHSAITMMMCSVALILTELVSNTAAITILLPVIQQMSLHINVNPISVMLPVTVCCSYAFMLPFASGTNAIVFEVGKMKNKDLLLPGSFMKIISLIVLMVMNSTWGRIIFDSMSPIQSQGAQFLTAHNQTFHIRQSDLS